MNTLDEGMPMPAVRLPAPVLPRSELQRGLAIAQQVKDTITIGLMLSTGMLIFGILFGVAIPGLVLYCLRWQQTRRYGRNARGGWLWLLTLLHELVCAVGFYSNHPHHDEMTAFHFEAGYALGAGISLLALLNSGWATAGRRASSSHGYQ
jgi:hypothetical protein